MVDVSFYKDQQKKTLRTDIFSTTAEKMASVFAEANDRINKRSQIRKFYDEVIRLNSMAKTSDENWENLLPYVHMLIAKATYAEGRNLVSNDFVKFMKDCIKQIETQMDLQVFADLFESLMGFYRKYRQS
ncbi:MAG TPA: type III-A CRISPR-associated protein Csm2 [Syntrophobacteraceae bacterium]|jgi:CRISPR-associated protein Csm2|nr:type III-A CRISPR-associated protein Csm2 [Syntrophobacteraceae bacterium]HBZ54142.1 type III-A CRISPR-associated protein Csm2 [Syntrophobacteraceae bacterium]